MKKFFLLLLLGISTSVFAQEEEHGTPYLEVFPDATKFLTAPPSLTSGAWYNDFYYYQWGKEQRLNDSIRQRAIDDYFGTSIQYLEEMFSPAFGLEISKENTPELHVLANNCLSDAYFANKAAKNIYQRQRPFMQMGEQGILPEYDEEEAADFCYPSGHSSRCYVAALVLAMVNPDATDDLLRAARDYSINRVICGHHYKSDVEASVYLSMAVVARLHGNAEFMKQYNKALQEFQAKASGISETKVRPSVKDNTYTSLSGVRYDSKPTTAGVYINNGTKIAITK